jgi:hypothetical protein
MTSEEKNKRSTAAATAAQVSTNAQQRRIRGRNRGSGSVADWATVEPVSLINLVAHVTGYGFAVRFGYSRDGGAYAVGMIGDGDPFTEYCRATEDINVFLDDISRDYAK